MKLTQNDSHYVAKHYTKILNQHGPHTAKALDYNDEFTQQVRFKVLSEIANLNGKSILDIGCGLGDMFGFLRNKFSSLSYLGIDITPDYIHQARAKYPEGEFEVGDYSQLNTKTEFDYILASGIFTAPKLPDHTEKVFASIKKLYKRSKHGFGFNMLDVAHHSDDEVYAAFSPEEVVRFCNTFADTVELSHDYLTYDFTLYLYHTNVTK